MPILKKGSTHEQAIVAAEKQYQDSVNMFLVAEQRVSGALGKLDLTIDEIDASIEELQAIRIKALGDKERYNSLQQKLKDFTA